MKTSAAGRAAITRREGNELKAYQDSVNVWTIGVGHTSMAGPPKVTAGLKITAAESDEILSRDLAKFEAAVDKAVKVPVTQNEFDALVSLAFNIGGGAFAKSTLVRKLNAGDRKGAADAFLSWNKAGGKTLKGLTTRRQDERSQFLKNAPVAKPAPPPKPKDDNMVLKLGDEGKYVEDLQNHLNTLGFGPLTVSGEFDKATENAVGTFQSMNGLKADAIVGIRTSTAIGEALKAQEVAPKLMEAEKNVPPTATKEVKEKTNFGAWAMSLLGVGGTSASAAFSSDWTTVLAVAGAAIVALIVILLMRRQIIAAFKEINQS